MIKMTLTPDELYQALVVGGHRRITCIRGRQKPQHYSSPNGDEWSTEIESCCAELVVSKYLGKYWSGGVFSGERAGHDVDGKQVRCTPHPNGRLIIYPEDNPEDNFILVTGRAPDYIIRGWINGAKAISKGTDHTWWTEPTIKRSPSWWVPQEALRPMPTRDELRTV